MVRAYGEGPRRIAVIHGGPGAPGAAAGLARELGKSYGVLEPMQSRDSIAGLIEELGEQLQEYCACPAALIGHSWGAWLAGLLAAARPQLAGQVILVGCPPLDAGYVPQIQARRMENLSREERAELEAITEQLAQPDVPDKDQMLLRLRELAEAADYYQRRPLIPREEGEADGGMYARIWPEAAAMRQSGALIRAFRQIRCPLSLFQGKHDPHPYEGVVKPLEQQGIVLSARLLDQCGHTPWLEVQAAEQFFVELKNTLGIFMCAPVCARP